MEYNFKKERKPYEYQGEMFMQTPFLSLDKRPSTMIRQKQPKKQFQSNNKYERDELAFSKSIAGIQFNNAIQEIEEAMSAGDLDQREGNRRLKLLNAKRNKSRAAFNYNDYMESNKSGVEYNPGRNSMMKNQGRKMISPSLQNPAMAQSPKKKKTRKFIGYSAAQIDNILREEAARLQQIGADPNDSPMRNPYFSNDSSIKRSYNNAKKDGSFIW
jgi:hypothetical protein